MNNCRKIKTALLERLLKKGLDGNNLPGFVKLLFRYLKVNPDIKIDMLNRHLNMVGFPNMEIDYHTFQLAIAYFESKNWKNT